MKGKRRDTAPIVDTPDGAHTLRESFGDTLAGRWLAEHADDSGWAGGSGNRVWSHFGTGLHTITSSQGRG